MTLPLWTPLSYLLNCRGGRTSPPPLPPLARFLLFKPSRLTQQPTSPPPPITSAAPTRLPPYSTGSLFRPVNNIRGCDCSSLSKFLSLHCFAQVSDLPHTQRSGCCLQRATAHWPYTEHTFSSIIHNLGGMLNNWSELGGLSAWRSFACSWWICGIQCTLLGERGNIVLSCVSVFTAHSLINYSAGPSRLWPAVLRRGPSLFSRRRVCDSISFSYCAAFHVPAGVLLCISQNTRSLFFETLLMVLSYGGRRSMYDSNCLSSSSGS